MSPHKTRGSDEVSLGPPAAGLAVGFGATMTRRRATHGRRTALPIGGENTTPGDHVNVGFFFFGALLKDPAWLLEGTSKRGRHVKLRPGREVDSAALAQLVHAAYVDIRARLRKWCGPEGPP
jgi:Domain of unknown function (DU1801)